MECPKCHKNIEENVTVCPHCHKVLALVCPNCGTLSKNSVCSKCGYIILTKCSKCGKMVPTSKDKCKCGFLTATSVAYNECETDEFASLIVKFAGLNSIKGVLASQELYSKFLLKLRNLISAQVKDIEGCVVNYGDSYVVNFNKELSFPTSANKAVRLGLKLINVFSGLNLRIIEEFGTPLKLTIAILKKTSEELLTKKSVESNVKLLMVKKENKRYLKGMQLIIDQFVQDSVNKEYKTDSLYSIEQNGNTIMYYELILEDYILPPNNSIEDRPIEAIKKELNKNTEDKSIPRDMFGFKVFDINAKCKFERCDSNELFSKLTPEQKIVSIRTEKELGVSSSSLVKYYLSKGLRPLYIVCSEELTYKPWGFFELLFKEYYGLSTVSGLMPSDFSTKSFEDIKNMIKGYSMKASTAEDARFAYMELFGNLLKSIKDSVIIVDGFEYIDDTSIQTLELYFDNFNQINTNFVFITDSEVALHSKIKGLLRTPKYTEFVLQKAGIDSLLSDLKSDASDFIQSFYYEKIKENFAGSKLYFDNALRFLGEKDVLISFENKLIIKNNASYMLPKDLSALFRLRLKGLSKNQEASMILAYSAFLGYRLDFKILELLGIKDVQKNVKLLENLGFVFVNKNIIYVDNFTIIRTVIHASLKREAEEFLAKNILAKLGKLVDNTMLLLLMGATSMFKEEYLLLWKNSQFAISVGDYDAYLKNCLGFLSIIDKTGDNISQEDIEKNKKEVFQNILMSLYAYSPAKIYSIENILLVDAIQAEDNESIIKLSNLMLQGALISSNYTEALSLLHNILTRMPNPSLIVDGAINTKFLLLSLVHIEILFNIGDYRRCIDIGKDLLGIIRPEIIEKIKPSNFSTSSFVEHMFDTFRLVGLAKLICCDSDLSEFFASVKVSLNEELPEKGCILALKDYLDGKNFAPSNVEEASAFEKVIYLILQEFAVLKGDYKSFAQNIYQAKLLAADIHQTQLEYICDTLIAFAYAKIGIPQKAQFILNDVLEKAKSNAIFNVVMLANYFISIIKISRNDYNEAIMIINDSLAAIQKRNNQAKLFYALFERLFIDLVIDRNIKQINVDSEIQSLLNNVPNKMLDRIIRRAEIAPVSSILPEEEEETFVHQNADIKTQNTDEEKNITQNEPIQTIPEQESEEEDDLMALANDLMDNEES